jgi:NitT/TauT family transport system substrate-binding protein
VLAGGSLALAPRCVRAQSSVIRLASSVLGDSYAQPYYALDKGYFERAGLNVQITSLTNAGTIAQAVAGGAVDAGFADAVLVANAVNRGIPWAFIAGGGLYVTDAPTTVLVVGKNSPVRQPRDLEGGSIAVAGLALTAALAAKAWIDANNLDATKIKLYELPPPAMAAALDRGDVTGAFLGEPYLSQAKDQVKVLANAFDAISKTFLINGCFTTRVWVGRNSDTAKRLARAIDDAGRWANGHHDESSVILSKYSTVPVAAIRTTTRVRYGPLEPRYVQPLLDAAFKYKLLTQPTHAADIIARV